MTTNDIGKKAAVINPADINEKVIQYFMDNGLQILTAIAILVAGVFLGRWFGDLLHRWLEKRHLEPQVTSLITKVVKAVIISLFLIMALGQIGVQVTPLLAGIGVAGVGVSLAMQGLLGNVVAGLTIIFTKPFTVGDYIEVLSVYGQVIDISLFSTILLHADASHVVVPNRKIVGEILHNYGKIRQLDLNVSVSYTTDLTFTIATIKEVLDSNVCILKDPEPVIGVSSLESSSIRITIKPWVSVDNFCTVPGEIHLAIVEQFRTRHINIPLPQHEVRFVNSSSENK
jgi:small conductance mechanosensitive channel